MENDVLAEHDGIVKSIKISVGDSVLQGDTLIEIG
ncbi:MAG: biotin/lipoyl-containing protein [Bacteroidales bacterium]|nr:biotin/lipoyl-containing protein [Bacteroidales bacterium]